MFIITQIPFVDFRLISDKDYAGDKDSGCFFPNIFLNYLGRSKYYRFLRARKKRYAPSELPISERNFFNPQKAIKMKSNRFIYMLQHPSVMVQWMIMPPRLLWVILQCLLYTTNRKRISSEMPEK